MNEVRTKLLFTHKSGEVDSFVSENADKGKLCETQSMINIAKPLYNDRAVITVISSTGLHGTFSKLQEIPANVRVRVPQYVCMQKCKFLIIVTSPI